MQRYSRDRDRDDEGGRSERGAQARNEERYTPGQRDLRNEFSGRREPDYDRGGHDDSSAYGSSGTSSGRWRESGRDRERFEQAYGRGGQQSDYGSGGSSSGNPQREDDWLESRSSWNEQSSRWQPGNSPSWSGERRGQYSQYGETEYGMYGPRYAGTGSGQSNYGSGGYWGTRQRGGHGPRYDYGDERGDDRRHRQGYGQSAWQHESERGEHQMDPDYQQWREEQIRNLDADYQRYRQERYRKFADEFGLWRKNRESSMGPSDQGSSGQGGIGQTSTGNQSGMGSSAGQTSAGTNSSLTGSSSDTSKETKSNR